MGKSKVVAFVPARKGSARVPDKNIQLISGRSLLEITIRCAFESGVFDWVVCVTDDPHYASLAESFGAYVPALRPASTASSVSPDIEWVRWIFQTLQEEDCIFDAFAILRPTSPFRRSDRVREAVESLLSQSNKYDSLRAMSKCSEHPGKCWTVDGNQAFPILPYKIDGVPWHSNQYQKLPEVYVQNASLEVVFTETLVKHGSISGSSILPLIMDGIEGFDINSPLDLEYARLIAAQGE